MPRLRTRRLRQSELFTNQLLSEFFVYNQRRYCGIHAAQYSRAAATDTRSHGGTRAPERRLTMLVNAYPPAVEVSAET